jgi:hypothetical protein
MWAPGQWAILAKTGDGQARQFCIMKFLDAAHGQFYSRDVTPLGAGVTDGGRLGASLSDGRFIALALWRANPRCHQVG